MQKVLRLFSTVRFSLALFLTVILLLSIISVSLIICTKNTHLNYLHQQLAHDVELLDKAFTTILEENRKIMSYMGQHIARCRSNDLNCITSVLKEASPFKPDSMKDQIAPAYFSWANEQGYIIVTEHAGILPSPKNLSYRDYYQKCKDFPWMLHVSRPDASVFRKTAILPIALGVTDATGHFQGFIPIGLRIRHLLQLLKNVLTSSETKFVICNEQLGIILHNNPISISSIQLENSQQLNQKQGQLLNPWVYNNVAYSHYKKINGYPFIILIGFNQAFVEKSFYPFIQPAMTSLITFAMLIMLVIFILQKKILCHLNTLAMKVTKITKGKIEKEISLTSFYGTEHLIKALNQVINFMSKKEKIEGKLHETIALIQASDKAAHNFVQQLHEKWSKDLNFISNSCSILLQSQRDQIDLVISDEKQQVLLEKVYQSALNIKGIDIHYTYDEIININTLLEECILIISRIYLMHEVTIKDNFTPMLPSIKGDRLCFLHIIVSLLCSALASLSRGKQVLISTSLKEQKICIEIKDGGFGLSPQDLMKLDPQFKEEGLNWEKGYPCLTIRTIESLINKIGGTLKIKNEWGKGKVIELSLPYKETISSETNDATQKLPSNVYSFQSNSSKK